MTEDTPTTDAANAEPPAPESPSAPSPRARGRQKGSILVPLVVVAVVLVAGIAAAWFFMLRVGGNAEQIVNDFMVAHMANDLEGLKLCVTAEGREAIEKAQEQLGGQMPASGLTLPFTVGEPTITGDEARIDVTIQLPRELARLTGQTEETIPVIAVKEGGAWKVDLAKTEGAQMPAFGSGGAVPLPSR